MIFKHLYTLSFPVSQLVLAEGLKAPKAEEIWSLLDAEKKGYVEREALHLARGILG